MSVDGILVSVYVIPVAKIKECSTRCNYGSKDERRRQNTSEIK